VDLANLGSVSKSCVGSHVRLVGAFISFEKNFYRLSHSLPPSLVRRIGPSLAFSIDGSLVPYFDSTLFGDTMAAAWVQKNARCDGFPSSQFGQINSPKRNALEAAFSLFKLPLKFSDQRRKSKRSESGKNRGEPPPGPTGPVGPGRPAHPTPGAGPVPSPMSRPFFAFLAREKKVGPVNLRKKLQKYKRKTIYKNQHLVLHPRLDVQALLLW
jgi:hypothetical protein